MSDQDLTCKKCGREFDTLQALGGHVSNAHRGHTSDAHPEEAATDRHPQVPAGQGAAIKQERAFFTVVPSGGAAGLSKQIVFLFGRDAVWPPGSVR